MKKIAVILISLVLLISTLTVATAEQTSWYELSAEDTVLTVRLPGEGWEWEISDPEALELITQDTEDGLIASFMSTANAQNTVALLLRKTENAADAAIEAHVLELDVNDANVLAVNAVLTIVPNADWIELDADTNVLTVRLPGADWTFEIVDPQIIELLTTETTDDAFIASFLPTTTETGLAQLVFTTDDELNFYAVDIYAAENGELAIQRVEIFEIFRPADAA